MVLVPVVHSRMAPYQLILALLHAHGLPEARLTDAYQLILGRLQPGSESWFTTAYPESMSSGAERALLALQGSHPEVKAARQKLLADTLTQAFTGDRARAEIILQELLTLPGLN